MRRLVALLSTVSAFLGTCSSQAIVPHSVCEDNGVHCPGSENKPYETYCCLVHGETGGIRPYCCNPYVGLYIGLGVGIPLLIIIIISVILLYVCWTCYHRKQMRYLTRIYIEQRAAAAELYEQDSEQPPGYNTEDQHKIDSRHGLPSYSENDPYPDSSQPPPQYATEGSTVEVQPDVIRREEDNISEQDISSISDETTNDDQPLIN